MTGLKWCFMLIAIAMGSGCASTGKSPDERRNAILIMKSDALGDLYTQKPHTRAQISNAPGYAVFSNANLNVILASFGGGFGVVKNNLTGEHTFMKMAEVGIGPGAGVKDFRIFMVFNTPQQMQQFIESGWTVGAQADAAAKTSDKGAAVGGEAVMNNITVYQLTESGLALQATIKGSKFWRDDSLNH